MTRKTKATKANTLMIPSAPKAAPVAPKAAPVAPKAAPVDEVTLSGNRRVTY